MEKKVTSEWSNRMQFGASLHQLERCSKGVKYGAFLYAVYFYHFSFVLEYCSIYNIKNVDTKILNNFLKLSNSRNFLMSILFYLLCRLI